MLNQLLSGSMQQSNVGISPDDRLRTDQPQFYVVSMYSSTVVLKLKSWVSQFTFKKH